MSEPNPLQVRVWTIKRSREGRDGRANAAAMRKWIYSARPNPAPAPVLELASEKITSATARVRASAEAAADVAAARAGAEVRGKGPTGALGQREPEPDSRVENATGTSDLIRLGEPGVELDAETDRQMSAGGSGRGDETETGLAEDCVGRISEWQSGSPVGNRAPDTGVEENQVARPVRSGVNLGTLEGGGTEQKAKPAETEALQATPDKEGTRVGAEKSGNPSRSPSTPVNVEGFEDGRLGLNPGPSPQFAFWNRGSRVKAPQEHGNTSSEEPPVLEAGLQSPCLRSADKTVKVSEKAGSSPSRKKEAGSSVQRLPLSPTRVNIQIKSTPERARKISLGGLLDQQENVSPFGMTKTAEANGKDVLESPSSVLLSPPSSSRKRQRTIIDYFKNH